MGAVRRELVVVVTKSAERVEADLLHGLGASSGPRCRNDDFIKAVEVALGVYTASEDFERRTTPAAVIGSIDIPRGFGFYNAPKSQRAEEIPAGST